MDHILPDTFEYTKGHTVPMGGQVQVVALQLRYAINDRLAVIATEDSCSNTRPMSPYLVQRIARRFASGAVYLRYCLQSA